MSSPASGDSDSEVSGPTNGGHAARKSAASRRGRRAPVPPAPSTSRRDVSPELYEEEYQSEGSDDSQPDPSRHISSSLSSQSTKSPSPHPLSSAFPSIDSSAIVAKARKRRKVDGGSVSTATGGASDSGGETARPSPPKLATTLSDEDDSPLSSGSDSESPSVPIPVPVKATRGRGRPRGVKRGFGARAALAIGRKSPAKPSVTNAITDAGRSPSSGTSLRATRATVTLPPGYIEGLKGTRLPKVRSESASRSHSATPTTSMSPAPPEDRAETQERGRDLPVEVKVEITEQVVPEGRVETGEFLLKGRKGAKGKEKARESPFESERTLSKRRKVEVDVDAVERATERALAKAVLLERLDAEEKLLRDGRHPLLEASYQRLADEKALRLSRLAECLRLQEEDLDRGLATEAEIVWRQWADGRNSLRMDMYFEAQDKLKQLDYEEKAYPFLRDHPLLHDTRDLPPMLPYRASLPANPFESYPSRQDLMGATVEAAPLNRALDHSTWELSASEVDHDLAILADFATVPPLSLAQQQALQAAVASAPPYPYPPYDLDGAPPPPHIFYQASSTYGPIVPPAPPLFNHVASLPIWAAGYERDSQQQPRQQAQRPSLPPVPPSSSHVDPKHPSNPAESARPAHPPTAHVPRKAPVPHSASNPPDPTTAAAETAQLGRQSTLTLPPPTAAPNGPKSVSQTSAQVLAWREAINRAPSSSSLSTTADRHPPPTHNVAPQSFTPELSAVGQPSAQSASDVKRRPSEGPSPKLSAPPESITSGASALPAGNLTMPRSSPFPFNGAAIGSHLSAPLWRAPIRPVQASPLPSWYKPLAVRPPDRNAVVRDPGPPPVPEHLRSMLIPKIASSAGPRWQDPADLPFPQIGTPGGQSTLVDSTSNYVSPGWRHPLMGMSPPSASRGASEANRSGAPGSKGGGIEPSRAMPPASAGSAGAPNSSLSRLPVQAPTGSASPSGTPAPPATGVKTIKPKTTSYPFWL